MDNEVLKKIVDAFEAQIKITEALISDLKKTIETLKKPEGARRKKGEKEEPAAASFNGNTGEVKDIAPVPPVVTEPPKGQLTEETKAKLAEAGIGHPELKPHTEGGPLLVKDVTIEQIRERSTVYSDAKNFGMDAWLALAQKITGQKKVKDIPKELYGLFYATMGDDLEKLVKDRANLSKPSLVPPATNTAPVEQKTAAKGEITLETVRGEAAKFIETNGQPALVALVKAFGATKISEIAKEKYPAFMEALGNA